MRPRAQVLLGGLVLASLISLTACQGDPLDDYCEEVAAQQRPISEALGEGGPTALIEALPSFEALREESPSDLRDEWDTVVARIRALVEALDAAEVDPATYDAENPPEGLAPEAKARIAAAADQLDSGPVADALDGVQQQARDVCKNPLSL